MQITRSDPLAKSTRSDKNLYTKKKSNGANLGFEETLWQAADRMRGKMDAAEYKHVVLGLIFLKYISDAFEERYQQLQLWTADPENPEYYVREAKNRYQTMEDRDEYAMVNVFWVPAEARWEHLRDNARQPTIGKTLDDAMTPSSAKTRS
jgi:type I restriction enzyme M protein